MTSPKTVLCTVRVYNTLLSVVSEDLDGFMQQTDNNARLLLLLQYYNWSWWIVLQLWANTNTRGGERAIGRWITLMEETDGSERWRWRSPWDGVEMEWDEWGEECMAVVNLNLKECAKADNVDKIKMCKRWRAHWDAKFGPHTAMWCVLTTNNITTSFVIFLREKKSHATFFWLYSADSIPSLH